MKDKTIIYPSCVYNLRILFSPLLLNNYKENYINLIEYSFTFMPNKDIVNQYLNSDYNYHRLSAYLIFNIINSLLRSKNIVKKDFETYYNKQLLNYVNFYKKPKDLKLKTLAVKWNQINNLIDYIFNKIKEYDEYKTMYNVNWSDGINNYYEEIPLIGFKENNIEITFIIQKDLDKYPITGKYTDLITIPSIIRCLYNFIDKYPINISKVNIIYLDHNDIDKNIKIVEYPSVLFKNVEFLNYIRVHGNNNNYKSPILTYTPITNYYSNNLFSSKDFLVSTNHNDLRNNAHLIYSTSKISKA